MRTLLFYVIFTILAIVNILANLFVWIINLPADFLKAQKVAFKAMMSKIPHVGRKTLPKWFDYYGLRYDINYLQSLSLKDMVLLEDEELADYVDEVTYNFCKKKKRKVMPYIPLYPNIATLNASDDDDDISFRNLNATSLGNIAYLSLNHPNHEERQQANSLLIKIRKHYTIH